MSILKTATTAVVCASLLAGNFVLGSGAAEARDWRRDRGSHAYDDPAPHHFAPSRRYQRYAPAPRHETRRRDKSRRIATGIAIGVGALILGSILAAESNRHR